MRINKSLKTIFFTLLFFGISSFLFHFDASAESRPYYGWTRTIGGTAADGSVTTVADSQGNLYFGGTFTGTNINFNTTGSGATDIKSSNGLQDIFITKYNNDGSYGWTRTIGNTVTDSLIKIFIDNDDNIYFTGSFGGTNTQFNTTGSGSSDLKSSVASQDIFITKYNSDGSYAWTRTMGGTVFDQGAAISTDSNRNIYLVGFFQSSNVQFNTTGSGPSDIKSSNGSDDIFITKFNNDGSYGWTRIIGGTASDSAASIFLDNQNTIFISGSFSSSNVEFNTTGTGSSDIKSSAGSADIFVTKYNGDGSYSWTRTIGGTDFDSATTITTDSDRNIYFSGFFRSLNMNFNTTGVGGSDIKSTAGINDIFITKYNSDESYAWTRTIGGTLADSANGLIVDTDGSIYFAGQFQSTNTEFNTTGAGASDIRSTAGSADIFVTKYNDDASYAWTQTIGGTLLDTCRAFSLVNGTLYLTGNFASINTDFNRTGFGDSDIHSTAGNNDIFITKLTDISIKILLKENGISSDENITLTEGSSNYYQIVLNAEPTDDVTVTLSYGSGITVSPSNLTFTASNWNTLQTITLTAVNDSVVSGNRSVTISHTVTSDDPIYNGISIPDMTVNIIEDDTQTTSTGKKASSGAGVGLGNGTDVEVELEVESEEKSEITITPTPTKNVKPTNLPETGKDGSIKGEGIKFTTVAVCSLPFIIVIIIMILATRRKKKRTN